MNEITYGFRREAVKTLNSGKSRSILLTGNVNDLFFCSAKDEGAGSYQPLIEFLTEDWQHPDRIIVIYELNGPVRFVNEQERKKVQTAWNVRFAAERGSNFDTTIADTLGKPTLALEFLRQLCLLSRGQKEQRYHLRENLIVIIEGIDLLVPEKEIAQLPDADRHRIAICHDWFSDPGFMNGNDSVVLIAESRSSVNHRVSRLPQLLETIIPAPDAEARTHFIEWFGATQPPEKKVQLACSEEDLVRYTGCLSIHALRQLLMGASHESRALGLGEVAEKVREFIQMQLGEDVVEYRRPSHKIHDLIGYTGLKNFMRTYLMPRIKSSGSDALSGAIVCGPIGGGKTFMFEAMAAELEMVVLVLKNIRSQFFGQTDVIFERFRRIVEALPKALILVDEADTQFGGVGHDTHETERRLTGKVQSMMSDSKLRGKVVWLLITARINLLPADMKRQGRGGDLIIPVLDPEGADREEFLLWAIAPAQMDKNELTEVEKDRLLGVMDGYSTASYNALRAEIMTMAKGSRLSVDAIIEIAKDILQPNIQETRHYQTLQALLNCTRRSLLPNPQVTDEERKKWRDEIRVLEAIGEI